MESNAADGEMSTGGSHLARERGEQPEAVERVLREQREEIERAAALARGARVDSVLIAARGTSDNVARYAQHVLGRFCRLPVGLATPSLTTLYDASPKLARTLVIGISQSGESPDVNAVVADARDQGCPTLAITNEGASPLPGIADVTIDIRAGAERSVAATKTYTASLAAVAALTAEMAGEEALRGDLERVGAAMAAQLEAGLGGAVELFAQVDRCAVAARGANYATAHESALKIKELTAIAAEPFSSADAMHGPLAVLGADCPLVAFGVAGPALASVAEVASAAGERGAICLALTDTPGAFAGAAALVALAEVAEWLSPLVAVLPAQELAQELALSRGVAVDEPFGLSKVTRTV